MRIYLVQECAPEISKMDGEALKGEILFLCRRVIRGRFIRGRVIHGLKAHRQDVSE